MIALLSLLLFSPSVSAKFDDAALRARLADSKRENSRLLIYFWSPQMPISVRGLDELFATKGARPYKVLALLDEGANRKEAEKIMKEKNWPAAVLERNESLELRKQGARVHYPAYLFVKDGAFPKPLLPGYRTPEELSALAGEVF